MRKGERLVEAVRGRLMGRKEAVRFYLMKVSIVKLVMRWFLYLIPLMAVVSALSVYKKNGRKEFLKFDVVQFVYAFILSPVMFVWFKTFLFYILKHELDLRLSLNQLFFVDTTYSVAFLFVYAFVVIHSLTKSFENKRYRDPLYDVFKHSEELHLWVSHFWVYAGAMSLLTMISVLNMWFPLVTTISRWQFYMLVSLGGITGVVVFGGIWLSIFSEKFMRILKLMYGLFFLIHVGAYFVFDPSFNAGRVMYWFVFMLFMMLVFLSFFFDKSERVVGLFERLSHKAGWSAKRKRYLLSK